MWRRNAISSQRRSVGGHWIYRRAFEADGCGESGTVYGWCIGDNCRVWYADLQSLDRQWWDERTHRSSLYAVISRRCWRADIHDDYSSSNLDCLPRCIIKRRRQALKRNHLHCWILHVLHRVVGCSFCHSNHQVDHWRYEPNADRQSHDGHLVHLWWYEVPCWYLCSASQSSRLI